MINKQRALKLYFEWLVDLVVTRYTKKYYTKLLTALFNREFTWILPRDADRAACGINLRQRFLREEVKPSERDLYFSSIDGTCSVLEMMVALVLSCEENIMQDEMEGDRMPQWFWEMIQSLGLSCMDDAYYDEEFVQNRLDIFLNRKYSRTGEGGLFTLPDTSRDLRKVDIWYQMCWYLTSLLDDPYDI